MFCPPFFSSFFLFEGNSCLSAHTNQALLLSDEMDLLRVKVEPPH